MRNADDDLAFSSASIDLVKLQQQQGVTEYERHQTGVLDRDAVIVKSLAPETNQF